MNKNEELIIQLITSSDDIEQARQLINRAFLRQKVARKDRDTICLEDREQELTGQNKHVFILTEKGSKIPLTVAVVTFIRNHSQGQIQYLAAEPDLMGQGFGKVLLQKIEEFIRSTSCSLTSLTVIHHPLHPQESLVNWYKEQGYSMSKILTISDNNKDKWFEPQYAPEITAHYYTKTLSGQSKI